MKSQIKFLLPILLLLVIACSQQEEKKSSDFYGYVECTQLNVTTRMPGKITDIYVNEGDYVKENQEVAQLDTKELKAHREALVARLKNIKVNLKRVTNLYNAGAVPKQKLDEVETGYEIVRDNLAALDTKLEDMTIRSPINGVVNVRVLEVGQMMPPGMPVVIVTDTSATYARFSIPETYLEQVKLGEKINLKVVGNDSTVAGKVVQIVPMADFATHTPTTASDQRDIRSFSVRVKINNKNGFFKPGMNVYTTLNNPNRKGDKQ